MTRYFFILGRDPTLSLAEVIAVFTHKKIKYQIFSTSNEVAIIDVESNDGYISDLMKTFGGIIKIGKIINGINLDESEEKFQKVFSADNLTKNFLPSTGGVGRKLHLGISLYDGGGEKIYLDSLFSKLKSLNILAKENLKEGGVKVGFVKVKEIVLSSVSVVKNDLLKKGTEIVLVLSQKVIWVGKTLAVQEFEEFSKRDYLRPWKDKRSGIMPTKLARIMLNLAQIERGETLLDPFCGGGTILQEAIVLGQRSLFGSDRSGQAAENSRRNIDWLFHEFRNLDRLSYNIKIFQADARSISHMLKPKTIGTIVTEPYLGPPMYKKPDLPTIKKILNEIGILYIQVFRQFADILKSKGKIIIVFPAFVENNKIYFLEIIDEIKKLGFQTVDFFPQEIEKYLSIVLTLRKTILYGSREHFLKREILGFEKK